MLVGEVLSEATTVELDDTIAEAAHRMRMNGVGCLIVLSGGRVIGTISERDVALGCPVEGHIPWECRVFRHMGIQPETAHPNMEASMATILMIESDADCLPVVDGDRLIGVVYADDIFRATEQQFAYESEFTSLTGVE